MKTAIIAALVAVACIAFAGFAPISEPAPLPAVHVAPDAPPVTVELPTMARPASIARVVIVGQRKAPTAKHWTCGAMYDNAVGGRNADCKYL